MNDMGWSTVPGLFKLAVFVVTIGALLFVLMVIAVSTKRWHRTYHAGKPVRGCGRCQREEENLETRE